jgi:hypothetical protein
MQARPSLHTPSEPSQHTALTPVCGSVDLNHEETRILEIAFLFMTIILKGIFLVHYTQIIIHSLRNLPRLLKISFHNHKIQYV